MNEISTGYIPRPFQDEIHRNLKRFNVIVCHRRFGKTVLAVNEMVDQGLRCILKSPQYCYLAPFHGQSKRVAWEMLKDIVKNFPNIVINEAELRVDVPRPDRGDKIRFLLLGADNPTALLGSYFDGIILDEYASMDPGVWSTVLRPTLSDRMGWAIFISTPRGMNSFYDMLQTAKENKSGQWYWRLLTAADTGVVAQSELDEAKNTMSPEEFEQEFMCSFTAALIGAYYGKEMELAETSGRVTNVPYDPAVPVETAWDLGIGDTTCIWFFQQVGREKRAIDYIEDSGRGLDYYVKLLREKPYIYDNHHLPHDVVARDLSTGHSRQETLHQLGVKPIRVVPKLSIDDRINAARLLIASMWFDKDKCARGIAALKNYERRWNAKNKIFENAPLHNWASHGSDAFGHFALNFRDESKKIDPRALPRQAESDYDIFG